MTEVQTKPAVLNDSATRKELATQVAAANARANAAEEALAAEKAKGAALEERMSRLEAAVLIPAQPGALPAPAPTTLDEHMIARLMAAAVKELQESKPQLTAPMQAPSGPMPTLVPYRGYVRALQDCTYGGLYRLGPGSMVTCGMDPALRDPEGDVFEVDVPQLWSDDPYMPVIKHNNGFIPHPKAHVLDARWRLRLPKDSDLSIRAA